MASAWTQLGRATAGFVAALVVLCPRASGQPKQGHRSEKPVNSGELYGAAENPKDPRPNEELETKKRQRPWPRRAEFGYPIEEIFRPITLFHDMTEVGFALPVNLGPVHTSGLLQASYGVTRELTVGLRHSVAGIDERGLTMDKALAIDGHHLVTDVIAVQATIPVFLSPFALAITLGLPVKVPISDTVALYGGHDFLNVRLRGFLPVIGDARANRELAAQRRVRTRLPRGDLRFLGGVIYQLRPDLAAWGETGLIAIDFTAVGGSVPLFASLVYSPTYKLDLGGRIGFVDFGRAHETFGVTFLAALRI